MFELRFSIVIPVHNEADFLASACHRLSTDLEALGETFEVLLVENGSNDGTMQVAESVAADLPGFRALSLPDPDYGAAMRAGFLEGKGRWLVSFDIDYFSVGFLHSVMDREEDADLVLASKLAPGASDLRSPLRRIGTRVFNVLLRMLFGSLVSDTHGMKAVRDEVVSELTGRVEADKDLFDTELVLRAERAGYRIVEVPAVVEELRRARSSLLRRVPRTLLGLIRLRRRLRAEPGGGGRPPR